MDFPSCTRATSSRSDRCSVEPHDTFTPSWSESQRRSRSGRWVRTNVHALRPVPVLDQPNIDVVVRRGCQAISLVPSVLKSAHPERMPPGGMRAKIDTARPCASGDLPDVGSRIGRRIAPRDMASAVAIEIAVIRGLVTGRVKPDVGAAGPLAVRDFQISASRVEALYQRTSSVPSPLKSPTPLGG